MFRDGPEMTTNAFMDDAQAVGCGIVENADVQATILRVPLINPVRSDYGTGNSEIKRSIE